MNQAHEKLSRVEVCKPDFDPSMIRLEIITDKGGIATAFKKGESMADVIYRLEQMTHALKTDVLKRAEGTKA